MTTLYHRSPAWMKKIAQRPRKLKDRRGEGNGNSKLTEREVAAIRSAKSPIDYIAWIFGLSTRHVYNIRARKAWAHL